MSNSVTGYAGNAKKNESNRGVKGSKYKQKQAKGKGKDKAPAQRRDDRAPVFLYTSVCCGELAKKTACLIDRSVKFEERKASLGHWRCSKCHRACKVSRKLNKDSTIPFSKGTIATQGTNQEAEIQLGREQHGTE